MFATITPTRRDRPQFLDLCKHQLGRMDVMPTTSYFVDYDPKTLNVDLVTRLKIGIERAKKDGFDMIFIIEDDDYYPKNYFNIAMEAEFIGSQKTTYYNLRNRTYQDWDHPRRSSLFCTGFKISAIENFNWPEDDERFVDLTLWQYCMKMRRTVSWTDTKAIGIKHGIGLCGGRGHVQRNKYNDPELEWLKGNVDTDAFTFYSSLKL